MTTSHRRGRHRRSGQGALQLVAALAAGGLIVAGVAVGTADTQAAARVSDPAGVQPARPVSSPPPDARNAPLPPRHPSEATVARVIDGDTFVTGDGKRVRVLGADSCEMSTAAGPRARDDATALLRPGSGQAVRLRAVASGRPDTDRYGRLLRHVELPDGRDLGAVMVGRDHTAVYTGHHDASPAYVAHLRALDRDGRRCFDDVPDTVTPDVIYRSCDAARAAGAAPLNLGDRGYSRALDANGDGVACE